MSENEIKALFYRRLAANCRGLAASLRACAALLESEIYLFRALLLDAAADGLEASAS